MGWNVKVRWLLCAGLLVLGTSDKANAAPQKIMAVSQTQPGGVAEIPGAPSDSVLFYDVTQLGSGGSINNDPLFAVWMGFEIFEGEVGDVPGGKPLGNREEYSALTVNPANGTIYAAAFDSGSAGIPDPVGDTQGDFDLYRIDYQAILSDFIANERPRGTIYAPETLNISLDDEEFLSTNLSPLFDGVVDGLARNVPHPSLVNTVHLPGSVVKIGEVGRAQTPNSFFDPYLDFINPETFVMLDGPSGSNAAGDHQIRQYKRISTAPGAAVLDKNGADNITGPVGSPGTEDDYTGGNNGNTAQSWESQILGRLAMDPADDSLSDPDGWALVRRDGVLGVWVADGDGGGDEVAFFELDLDSAAPTATRKELAGVSFPLSFRVDEDPTVDALTEDGEIDFLAIDREGNLLIGESGFNDEPQTEGRIITVGIENYDDANGQVASQGYAASGNVDGFDSTGPWGVSAELPISGAIDNDADVTDIRHVFYDKGAGLLYIIDQDTGFTEDLYVFDPATGQIVYSEFNPFDIGIFNDDTVLVFTRGDINGDGTVDAADVSQLTSGISDPTLGGTVSASVGAEWYDLTGDGMLDAADMTELLAIIGAATPGDFDSDGDVDGDDYAAWQGSFGATLAGQDFLTWQRNFGAGAAAEPSAAAVPEPSSLVAALVLTALAGSGCRPIRSARELE